MAMDFLAVGDSLSAPFSREVVLYDQQNYLLGGFAVILRGTGVFTPAYMKFSDKKTSTLCDHPIEDGSMVSDHKVLMPRDFTLTVALPERYGYGMIKELDAYFKSSEKIIVRCATGVYFNMILTEPAANITPERLSRPLYDLTFREVVVVQPQIEQNASTGTGKTANEEDQATKRSTAYPAEADEDSSKNIIKAMAQGMMWGMA